MVSTEKQPSDILKSLLESFELDQTAFIENNLTTLQDLSRVGEESSLYKNLTCNASEIEIQRLKFLIKICVSCTEDFQSTSDQILKTQLEENGFEPSYWLPVFKEHLGVRSTEGLKNIGSESYALLLPFAQNELDSINLKVLFGMNQRSFMECRSVQVKAALERCKQIQQLTKILENLNQYNVKDEAFFKTLKDIICEQFQIASVLPAEISLGYLIEKLKIQTSQLCKILDVSSPTTELTNSEVFDMASNDIALQGILLVQEFAEKIKENKPLLSTPVNIEFSHPHWEQFSETVHFSHECHEQDFLKAMEQLGISGLISSTQGFTTEAENEKSYLSSIRYEIVPMASCYIDDSKLRLSTKAINYLKEREACICSGDKEKAKITCCQFLREFGSHIFKGYYHFGGVFLCISTTKDFSIKNDDVKRLHSKLNDLTMNSFWLPTALEFQAVASECSVTLEKTQSTVKTIGGPNEFLSFSQWKNSLVANNKCWCLIDRGRISTPVWKVIKEKHKEEFKNADDLASMLVVAFDSINTTLSHSKPNPYIPLRLRQDKDANDVVQKVNKWVSCFSSDYENKHDIILNQLQDLYSSRQSQIKAFIDPIMWPTLYLSQPIMLQYLKRVINYSNSNEAIINLLKQLVTLIDIDIVKNSPRSDVDVIADVLYHQNTLQQPKKLQCREFLYLHCVINQILEQLQIKNTGNLKYLATQFIEQLFEQYVDYLHKTKQSYELLFLYTLLYPFSYSIKEKVFHQLLDVNELHDLARQFDQPVTDFFQECASQDVKMQAYIFYLTVNPISKGISDLISKTSIHIKYLRDELSTKLAPQISNILDIFDTTDDWNDLRSNMFAEFKKTVTGTKSLLQLLQTNVPLPSFPIPNQNSPPKLNMQASLTDGRFKELLETLMLMDKYPEKLTKKDAMLIHLSALEGTESTDQLHMLPYLVLQKIMMCDCKCRTNLFKNKQLTTKNSDKDTDDDVSSSSADSDSEDEDEDAISPVDIILMLLYCSDNLLRQILLHKLSLCQLAIPCLLPDPSNGNMKYLLWSMRSIIKAWKDCSLTKFSYKECHIVDHKVPIITFLRIGHGTLQISKSSILNEVISESKQEIFFNWHSDGGNYNRRIINGVVELCWYLPSGCENDLYHDPIAFFNLRGNASDYPLQLGFIEKVSNMLFILIGDDKELDHTAVAKLNDKFAKRAVLILYSKKQKQRFKNLPCKPHFLVLERKNNPEIRKDIHSLIQQNLHSLPGEQILSLSECSLIADELKFMVDENDPTCSSSKQFASCIMEEIKSYPTTEAKLKLLPLQSPSLWHKWAEHDKERNRQTMKHNTSISNYNALKDSEKLQSRKLQVEKSNKLTPAMEKFLCVMLNCGNNTRKYFLEWMKLFLDDHSRKIFPGIFNEFQEIRTKILKMKEAHNDSATLQDLKIQLKRQSEQLSLASFGIVHFFRELSQIYESRMDPMQTDVCTNVKELLSNLPNMVAKLISEGYPMELMDGDASHVPITWISQVLNQLKLIYKDKKIFTISVLGIQSSGKSTLLNTMFGLQFNTSAGRCTKGVFFQLLAADSVLQSRFAYDLILIIDTEGLRAPELQFDGNQMRDNELATFVIGLADVTIINIKGETPAELNDILQTAVHAFIRMKGMSFQLRCYFVHQNIDDVTAGYKTKLGRQKFLDNLDTMTRSAAEIELCDSQLTSFKDVVAFNENTDDYFFPSLMKGDLPMTSVNPEYSKSAQGLKSLLLQQGFDTQPNNTSSVSLCTFTEFEIRVKHLWNAVLQENYVFSFKNSVEIVAYGELDTAINKWFWKFQCEFLEWRFQTENKIKGTSSSAEVEVKCNSCLGDAKVISSGICEAIYLEMHEFFNQNKHKITTAQWKSQTEHRITKFNEEFNDNASHTCKHLRARQEDYLKIQELLKGQQCKLQESITTLVKCSREDSIELSSAQLVELFEYNWKKWKTDFVVPKFLKTEDEIYAQAESSLNNYFPAQYVHIKKKLDHCPLKQRKLVQFNFDPKKHLLSHRKKMLQDKDIMEAEKRNAEFIKIINHKLLVEDCQNFDDPMINVPLNELQKSITDFNNEKNGFTFTPIYIADIAIHVTVHIIDRCVIMLKQYEQKHDPLIKLEELKPTFMNSFINQYNQISSDITVAESFCQLLIRPITLQIVRVFPNMIISYMKQKAMFQSKKAFKCQILKDLLDRDNFEDYITYLENVEESFKHWSEIYIEDQCNEMTKLKEFSTQKLKQICGEINNVIKNISPKLDLKYFLKKFHKKLNGVIELNPSELINIIGIDMLTNYQLFFNEITGKISKIEEDILQSLQNPESKLVIELKLVSKQSASLLSSSLQGCNATCPFCKEQCEMSDPNHMNCDPKYHSLKIHRPICLARYKTTENNKLALDLCTALVGSKEQFKSKETNNKFVLYKKYQKVYPEWHISHETSVVPKYWKWFIATHNDQIATKFEASPADVMEDWYSVDKDEAVKSLQETYDLT